MKKILLRALRFIFLVDFFRFVFRGILRGYSAFGSLFRRDRKAGLRAATPDATMEISEAMIVHTSDPASKEIGDYIVEIPVRRQDMLRNMEVFEDTSLVVPLTTPNTAVVRESLEEVDFYIEQDLLTDAHLILEELARMAPNHELLKCKRHELNHIAKINRPDMIPLEEQSTKIVDYAQMAAIRAAK